MNNTDLWRTQDLQSVIAGVDRWDLRGWQAAVTQFPRAQESNARWGQTYGGDPVRDAFWGLLREQPEVATAVPAQLTPLADLFRRGMETPDWGRLHDTCKGDDLTSAVGAEQFVATYLANLPEAVREQAQAAAQAAQAAQIAQDAVEGYAALAQLLTEAGRPTEAADYNAQAAQAQAAYEQAAAAALTAQEGYTQTAEQQGAQLAQAANQAAQHAKEEAQESAEWMRGFSVAAGGDPQSANPEVARAAMEALRRNPHLKRLANFLGWAKRTARAAWRKSPRARTEFTGYQAQELNPETMAPWETMAAVAGTPIMRLDWQRRAVDGGVVHRQFSGKQQEGRGPLVIVRDESGSMSGEPHALAVALEWALLEIARRDRRDFYSIPFSGQGQFALWQAPAIGQPDPTSLLTHLAHFYGGGTEPYAPLHRALELLETGDLRADVLLITDEAFPSPPPAFLDRVQRIKARRPVRIVAVTIGAYAQGGAARDFADTVIALENLVKDKAAVGTALELVL